MKVKRMWKVAGLLAALAVAGGATAQEVIEKNAIVKGLRAPGPVSLPVEFDHASATLNQRGRRQAAEMADAMLDREFSGRRFLLVGHTDARGAADYNMHLSLKRANSLRDYLIERFGVPGERIEAEGRGEQEPLRRGDSASAHARNRRVDLRLLPER